MEDEISNAKVLLFSDMDMDDAAGIALGKVGSP